MPAYVIALEVIKDRDEFNKYRALVHDVLDKYEGKTVVSSEDAEVREGKWKYTKTVVIRFPSMGHAKRWYESPEYQKILPIRLRAAATDLILVDGKA